MRLCSLSSAACNENASHLGPSLASNAQEAGVDLAEGKSCLKIASVYAGGAAAVGGLKQSLDFYVSFGVFVDFGNENNTPDTVNSNDFVVRLRVTLR